MGDGRQQEQPQTGAGKSDQAVRHVGQRPFKEEPLGWGKVKPLEVLVKK